MNDREVANELIRRGIIGGEELNSMTLAQILIKRGIIGAEELNKEMKIFEILRNRGII